MTREEYLQLCAEYDSETHDLWCFNAEMNQWEFCMYQDPAILDGDQWNACKLKLRLKKRKIGQWIFSESYVPKEAIAVLYSSNSGWEYLKIYFNHDACFWEAETFSIDDSKQKIQPLDSKKFILYREGLNENK